jgi:hypothetical protein
MARVLPSLPDPPRLLAYRILPSLIRDIVSSLSQRDNVLSERCVHFYRARIDGVRTSHPFVQRTETHADPYSLGMVGLAHL